MTQQFDRPLNSPPNRQLGKTNVPYLKRAHIYAMRLTRYLVEQYQDEIAHDVYEPVVRKRGGSFQQMMRYNGERHGHRIVYGAQTLDWFYQNGYYTRYKTLRYMVPSFETGMRAVHYHVLHEFAHLLQWERTGGTYGDGSHRRTFQTIWQELLDLIPWGETDEFLAA